MCESVGSQRGHPFRSAIVGGNGQAEEAVLSGKSFAAPQVIEIVALQLERLFAPKDMAEILAETDCLILQKDSLPIYKPLALQHVAPDCPAHMIGRECRRCTDCCEGHNCQDLGDSFELERIQAHRNAPPVAGANLRSLEPCLLYPRTSESDMSIDVDISARLVFGKPCHDKHMRLSEDTMISESANAAT